MKSLQLLVLLCLPSLAFAVPSRVQQVSDSVYMIHDDSGNWGGMTTGITHQNASPYQAKKILDLSDLPQAAWEQAKAARLSLYFMVRDYSSHELAEKNGLDEAFEVVVNGQTHRYPTSGGAPVFKENAVPTIAWHDVAVPLSELKRGPNEIILRKAPGKPGSPEAKSDDYMYLGIDNSVNRANSMVNFENKEWTQERLTIPGGNGEYMIRLYLLTGQPRFEARWQPGRQPEFDDPTKLFLYGGARALSPTAEGLTLPAGQSARLEWSAGALDALDAAEVTIEASGTPQVKWLDPAGAPSTAPAFSGLKGTLEANRSFKPSGLLITASTTPVTIKSVSLVAGRAYHPVTAPVNIAPIITVPAKLPQPLKPSCRLSSKQIELQTGFTRAVFTRDEHLRLTSLRDLITNTELLRQPDAVHLFLVELNPEGKPAGYTDVPVPGVKDTSTYPRLSGADDFALKSIKPIANGFQAELNHAAPALRAVLTVTAAADGLRMGLKMTNTGQQAADFKIAFPHLCGLGISPQAADDYYYFPSGGGIINQVPALIRRGYGDHEALYQVMDLYSPELGTGLSVRADDKEGWHKVLAFRKHLPGQSFTNESKTWVDMRVRPEYRWANSLDAEVVGSSFSYEYLRRTRQPGAAFSPADTVLAVHAGDWHQPLRDYAAWAHRAWKFRPYPSALHSVRNMMAAGWGQGILFKDGKYRTDIIRPDTDCIELMSWWDWSPLGPFMTPFDKLETVLTPAQIKMWQPYFVIDPVTGQQMWNNQPGDYRGYNERFGGLPAFRKAVQTYKDMGALTTLYTDPFRLDENCETGRAHGKQWCVVGANGKLSTGYEVYNPCHDLPAVREWVATEMGRVMRETGADGIRLDEYGHRGWACYNPDHKHTYAEPGITQWQKATSEATRMIHEAMDKVNPRLVLTTEHCGYDYLMQYLEGCITYDLTVMKSPLRPLECNVQRFYFPECKAYELDHQGADLLSRKKFWNAVESFGRFYPPNMYTLLNENEDVYQGHDNEPLAATVTPYIYANRFSGAGKTMYHLYNALGHTYEGPVLNLTLKPGMHVVELLGWQELPVRPDRPLSAYLGRDDIACIAVLPRVLTITQDGNALQAQITRLQTGRHTLVLVNEKGEALQTAEAQAGVNRLNLASLPAGARPVGLKLLREGQLVDAAVIK